MKIYIVRYGYHFESYEPVVLVTQNEVKAKQAVKFLKKSGVGDWVDYEEWEMEESEISLQDFVFQE